MRRSSSCSELRISFSSTSLGGSEEEGEGEEQAARGAGGLSAEGGCDRGWCFRRDSTAWTLARTEWLQPTAWRGG